MTESNEPLELKITAIELQQLMRKTKEVLQIMSELADQLADLIEEKLEEAENARH